MAEFVATGACTPLALTNPKIADPISGLTSSDQRFTMLGGVHMSFKNLLFAMQSLGGDSSVSGVPSEKRI